MIIVEYQPKISNYQHYNQALPFFLVTISNVFPILDSIHGADQVLSPILCLFKNVRREKIFAHKG